MSTLALPRSDDLVDVVGQVWHSLLGTGSDVVPAEPVDATARLLGAAHFAARSWSATVDVSGPESRRVTVVVDEDCARSITRHLLLMTRPTVLDVLDTLGELANIIGGNLKSLMPAPSTLSLPRAARGVPTYDARLPVSAVDATWNGQPVLVTVHVTPPRGALP